MRKHGDRICFVDVETTSLDFENPRTLLLEVGLYITTMDLKRVAELNVVVRHDQRSLDAALWEDAAADMHVATRGGSGLAEECAMSLHALHLSDAEGALLDLLGSSTELPCYRDDVRPGIGTPAPQAPLWGGCSVLLDRMILRRDMPQLYGSIHYRTLDATSLKIAFESWGNVKVPKIGKPHRALSDAASASDLADVFRRRLVASSQEVSASVV
jgi:oligoribonuclease (3'-5' exoribonuclease)